MNPIGQNDMSAPQPQRQQSRRGPQPNNGICQQPHAVLQNGFDYNPYTVPYQQPHINYRNDSQYHHHTASFQQSYTSYQDSSNLGDSFGLPQLHPSPATNYNQGFGLGYTREPCDLYPGNTANSFNPWEQITQMGQPPFLASPHQVTPQTTGIMPPNLPPSHSAGYGDIDPWLQQLRSDNLPQQPVQQPMEGYSQMVESSISPPLGDQIQESGTPPSTALTQADPAQVEGDSPLNPIKIDDDFPPSSTLAPATEWVNVTDLVYAAKEEPGKDDMIHEAWIFINWMRSHRSELSFDEKAKTHKWFVSANDYKRLFYVRVDDGTKEYGWGLENRLRRLYASGRDMGQPKRTKTKQARSRNPREQRQPGRKEQEEKRGRARKEEQQGQKEESHTHRRKGRERIKKPNGSGRRGRRRRRRRRQQQQQNESHLEHNEKSEANNYPEGDVEERVRLEDGSEDPEMADLVADCERLMEEESEESEEE